MKFKSYNLNEMGLESLSKTELDNCSGGIMYYIGYAAGAVYGAFHRGMDAILGAN
ncbi:MAG: hypothetical protein JXR03_08480 [Cyclobacteriaceae bacterium]